VERSFKFYSLFLKQLLLSAFLNGVILLHGVESYHSKKWKKNEGKFREQIEWEKSKICIYEYLNHEIVYASTSKGEKCESSELYSKFLNSTCLFKHHFSDCAALYDIGLTIKL